MGFLRCYLSAMTLLLALLPLAYYSAAQENKQVYENDKSLAINNINADKTEISRIIESVDPLRFSSPDSFRHLSEFALYQSRKIRYQSGIYEALNKLGLYFRDRGMNDTAITLFKQAIPYAQVSDSENKAYILYNNIGNSYSDIGKYHWALENFYHALEAARKNKKANLEDLTAIYINIGIIWGSLREPEHALNSFLQAEQLAIKMQDTAKLIATRINLGMLYYTKGDLKKAEDLYKSSLRIAQERKIRSYQIYALKCLAQLYLKWDMPENAMTHIQAAYDLLQDYPATADIWLQVQNTLGAVYLGKKDYEKARPILLAVLKRAEAGNLKNTIINVESHLAELYAAKGSYRDAYEHMRRYASYKDSLIEQEKGRTMEVWMRSRINEKDEALMAQQLHITQQKSQLQAKNFLIGGTILISLLLLTVFISLARSYKHKQKLQQSTIFQLRQEQEINQLKAQVRGEEQERNRIAQELHDGIASQLWAIKLSVDSLQQQNHFNETQRQNLQAIYQQLDDTTMDVRKTAHNLMPSLLLEEGLATALASLCEQIAKNTGLEVDFMEYGTIPRMNADIELSLYRMVQELIQNVLKHAPSASLLLIQLSCTDSLLNITVEDNGVGFAVEDTAGSGAGLHHIRKRVQVLQGQMDLQSVPGKGTTIYLEFDIQHLL